MSLKGSSRACPIHVVRMWELGVPIRADSELRGNISPEKGEAAKLIDKVSLTM